MLIAFEQLHNALHLQAAVQTREQPNHKLRSTVLMRVMVPLKNVGNQTPSSRRFLTVSYSGMSLKPFIISIINAGTDVCISLKSWV